MNEGDDRSDGNVNNDEEKWVCEFTDEMREELRGIAWQNILAMSPEYEPLSTPQLLEIFEDKAFWVYCLSNTLYDETVLNTVRYILHERGCEKEVHRITEKVKTEGRKEAEDFEREIMAKSRRERMV